MEDEEFTTMLENTRAKKKGRLQSPLTDVASVSVKTIRILKRQ